LKVFLIGVDGQLGTDIDQYFTSRDIKVQGLIGLEEVDICDHEGTRRLIGKSRPDLVINTAAYHNVDLCEDRAEEAFRVNAAGVKKLASICRDMDIPLMHFSTDFVFAGDKDTPYTEDDCPGPRSIYAISKLAGEKVVQYMLKKYYLVRLSGLYGHAGCTGKGNINFVETMLRLAGERQQIRVVDDQVLTPTSTRDAAQKLYELIQVGKYGLYHMTNTGECSWYEFACEVFRLSGIDADINPITSKELGAGAIRPAYSVLDNARLRNAGISEMRHWKKALKEYIDKRTRG
jgi:dTDP-4-dehydrorhamnose reductase